MRERFQKFLLDQRFLIGAWVLQTIWYVLLHILHLAGSGGALMGVFLAGNVILSLLWRSLPMDSSSEKGISVTRRSRWARSCSVISDRRSFMLL